MLVLSAAPVLSLLAQWWRAEWIPRPAPNPDKQARQSVMDLLRIAPLRRIFIANAVVLFAGALVNNRTGTRK